MKKFRYIMAKWRYEWSGEDDVSPYGTFVWPNTGVCASDDCGPVTALYGAI